MKKNLAFILASAALCALALSCAREPMNPMDPAEPEDPREEAAAPITIRATVEELTTRVDFTPSYTGGKPASMALTWAEGDKLRVYDHADRSRYSDFDLKAGSIGQEVGEFTGIPVQASSYDLEVINGTFDYAAQTQPSDGVTTDLKYLASASGVSASELESVTFTEFSSVLAITAKMPSTAIAAGIKSVSLTASEPIFNGGNTLSVTFSTVGDEGGDGILHFFATLPQGDQAIAAGTTMFARFHAPGTDHTVYTRFCPLTNKTFTSNELNTININASKSDLYANYTTQAVGTADNPYMIADPYQMDAMRNLLASGERKYFKMIDDVDLDGFDWVPVNQDTAFQIDFDGDGHTISHLIIDGTQFSGISIGFIGLLHGEIHDVVFDGAQVACGDQFVASNNSGTGGIVIGRSGSGSNAANFSRVTVRNSTLTSGNTAFVGVLAGYIKKSNYIRDCKVVNTSVSSTRGNNNPSVVGGVVGEMVSNGGCNLSDCSAEGISVNGGCTNANYSAVGGLIGRISVGAVIIKRCHTTGSMAPGVKANNTNNVGGLVGNIALGTGTSIVNCYSTCNVVRGYTYAGGLVGKIAADAGVTIDHCFASGNIQLTGGYGGHGGLVGTILGTGVTVKNCIAWNGSINAGHATTDESSGAVVGYTHPNCVLTNNYRKPGMTFNGFFWAPSANFDHADVNGTATPLQVNTNGSESNLAAGTAADFVTANKNAYSYHGKHLDSGITVTPDDDLGWISSAPIPVSNPSDDGAAENPAYTGNNVWNKGTTSTIVSGVQFTHYHGTWEGQTREINIITTNLDAHNTLGLYYNYEVEGLKYLNEKCDYVDAVAGTNGSMTSHYIRVDDTDCRPGKYTEPWFNCALTIDGDGSKVDIVKVADKAAAAALYNRTVGSAGPLLVWKGNKLTAPQEWLDIDAGTEDHFITNTHPRTAIGITKDGKKVIQVTVDGRWTNSDASIRAIGMSTDLLAELMLQLGCYKAMNLDGGGGTQMWVYDQGDVHHFVNHPHNCLDDYEDGTNDYRYTWPAARRHTSCAIYVKSDLKQHANT